MNATPYAHPMQLADPRRFAQMQAALSSAEMFRKKADEWDEAHGFEYHLMTVGLILTTGLFGILLALGRTNPYRSLVTGYYAQYERKHDEIAEAHGFATSKEISRYIMSGKLPKAWKDPPAATRPVQARRPSPSATLAA